MPRLPKLPDPISIALAGQLRHSGQQSKNTACLIHWNGASCLLPRLFPVFVLWIMDIKIYYYISSQEQTLVNALSSTLISTTFRGNLQLKEVNVKVVLTNSTLLALHFGLDLDGRKIRGEKMPAELKRTTFRASAFATTKKCDETLCKKSHYLPGYNHPLTTGADDLWLSPKRQGVLGHQHLWLEGGYDQERWLL